MADKTMRSKFVDFLKNNSKLINRVGLILSIIGVLIIFKWGPPQPDLTTGISLSLESVDEHNKEVEKQRKFYSTMSQFGLGLILIGFAFQLFATYMLGGNTDKQYSSEINKNGKLSRDWIFWTFLCGGFILACYLAYKIFNDTNISICYDPKCYSELLDFYKLPLQIAAAGLTLSGFRALIFRSKQTSFQIDTMLQKNTFSNYIDHVKAFNDMLDRLEAHNPIEFIFRREMYRKIFPANSPVYATFNGDYDKLKEWADVYNQSMDNLIYLGEKNNKESEKFRYHLIPDWLCEFLTRIRMMNIKFTDTKLIHDTHKDSFKTLDDLPVDLNRSFYCIIDVIKELKHFCVPNSTEKFQVKFNTLVLNEIMEYAKTYFKGGKAFTIDQDFIESKNKK